MVNKGRNNVPSPLDQVVNKGRNNVPSPLDEENLAP